MQPPQFKRIQVRAPAQLFLIFSVNGIQKLATFARENDFFSLSLLGDKYSEETKWDLSLSTTDLDKILTTMIVKDLSIGASDSSYLFLLDH